MEEMTCGKGLAQNATLPARVSELIASIAAVLDHHTTALNPADASSKPECDAYQSLVRRHREVAASLASISSQMAGYANLPMGAHDERVLSDATAVAVFETLVRREQELISLLQQRLAIHEPMLQMMRSL